MLTLLRWKGGYAGDMLLNLILKSNPQIKTNVTLSEVMSTGKIKVSRNQIENFIQVSNMAFYKMPVDESRLVDEINELVESNDIWYIKSHYYESNKFNNLTVDITTNPTWLPFTTVANVEKSDKILNTDYNLPIQGVDDPELKKKYALYNVAKDSLMQTSFGDRTISISDILAGWEQLIKAAELAEIYVDISTKEFYNNWYKLNTQYFPSDRYKKYILDNNYDYFDTQLSLGERYCLLALSGEKFKVLS
jgi:hypothetical protein